MTRNDHGCPPRLHNGRTYFCSMELALMMIGGKWKPLILWILGTRGILRFGELRRRLPGVTQKMLTQQLRELEADGLVLREAYALMPPRVDYSLTERGQSLVPILESLSAWAKVVETQDAPANRSASA